MKLEDFAAYNRPQSKVSDERKFLDYIHSRNRWVEFIKSIDNAKPVSIAMKNSFHSQWVESGAFIREKINDDSILLKLLTLLLPTYDGDSLVLYRGGKIKTGSIKGSLDFAGQRTFQSPRSLVVD